MVLLRREEQKTHLTWEFHVTNQKKKKKKCAKVQPIIYRLTPIDTHFM